jgi:hypothetical protein
MADLNSLLDDIEALWNKIGLTSDERTQEKETIDERITQVFTNCLSDLRKRCRELEVEIVKVTQSHISLLETFGDTDAAIQSLRQEWTPSDLPLRECLLIATEACNRDKMRYGKLLERVEFLKCEAQKLFDALETPESDRGEWATLDSKFTADKLQRLETLVGSMSTDYRLRQDAILNANKLIATLSAELELEIPNQIVNIFATNTLSHASIAHVTQYAQELQTLKDSRVDQITRMATEITRLWCLLDVDEDARQEFLQVHSTLSATVIESCEKEIEQLVMLRAERLPVLIEQQEARIEQLLSTLHVIGPRADHGDDLQATFDRNEEELIYLTELHRKMEPFLELIGHREEMLLELHAAKTEPGKKPDPREEQRKRRMRALLPRLEKKLYQMLVEFREVNGRDLEWDAEPYINGLGHIILSDIELRAIRARARKRSTQRKDEPAAPPKRRSENNRMSSNAH